MTIEAMKQALEALRTLHDENMDYLTRNKLGGENNQCMVFARETITALRQSIEQAKHYPPECQTEAEKTAYAFGWWKALESVRAQKQEPVAHSVVEPLRPDEYQRRVSVKWVGQPVAGPLYTSPPLRQPLTDEEIIAIIHPIVMADMPDEMTDYEIARAIEAACTKGEA